MSVVSDIEGSRRRIMMSRSVSYTLPAVVAVALVSAGCGTATPKPAPRAASTTLTTTSKPPTTTSRTATTTAAAAKPASVGVCVDTTTNVRVADDQCDTASARYSRFWYQHTDTFVYPAIGVAVALAAGSFLRPSTGEVFDRGAPTKGGTVARGGLGKTRPDSSGGGGGSAGS
ncbi:hypothetical protein [Nocardia salmonicida]|uniref:hypothetical protein n=1 Tax=Nocardia salmonicida TaxID=53431 RepID=UPI002E2CD198|nr:hypothetical protein [Nocardia salmonicida]